MGAPNISRISHRHSSEITFENVEKRTNPENVDKGNNF